MIRTGVKLMPPFDALADEIEKNTMELQKLRGRITDLEREVAGLKTKYTKVQELLKVSN